MSRKIRGVYIVCVLMAVFFVGCGREGTKGEVEDTTYQETELTMEPLSGMIRSVHEKDGTAYVVTDETAEDDTRTAHLYEIAVEDAEKGQAEVTSDISVQGSVDGLCVSDEGAIYYVQSGYDAKGNQTERFLIAMDQEHQMIYRKGWDALLQQSTDADVSGMMYIPEQGLVLLSGDTCYVIDDAGNVTQKIRRSGSTLYGIQKCKEAYYCAALEDAGNVMTVKRIDFQNGSLEEEHVLQVPYALTSSFFMDSDTYDFLYADEEGIKGYDLKTDAAESVMDFMASNVLSGYSFCYIGGETFLGASQDGDGNRLSRYQKVDSSEIASKQEITLGAMYLDDSLRREIIRFNTENSDYRITYRDYSNSENPVTKMNVDILSGDVPDILCLSGLPVELYESKGLLADLTPYLEADQEIGQDDLLDSVRQAIITENGIYYTAASFDIVTVLGAQSTVGTEKGWTFADLKDLTEHMDDGTRLFYDDAKDYLLERFISYGYQDFVDWDAGSCSFDSDIFRDLLVVCNTGKVTTDEDAEETDWSAAELKTGQVLLEEGVFLSIAQYQAYRNLFGTEVNCIGFPCEDKNGSYLYMGDCMGIYAESEVKDGAWEFVRRLFSEEYQGENYTSFMGMPTRKDVFQAFVKSQTTTTAYTDAYGTAISPITDVANPITGDKVEAKPVEEADVNAFLELLNRTTKTIGLDDAIVDIVTEEAEAYFQGEKTVDETTKIIQNRVETYINEIK